MTYKSLSPNGPLFSIVDTGTGIKRRVRGTYLKPRRTSFEKLSIAVNFVIFGRLPGDTEPSRSHS